MFEYVLLVASIVLLDCHFHWIANALTKYWDITLSRSQTVHREVKRCREVLTGTIVSTTLISISPYVIIILFCIHVYSKVRVHVMHYFHVLRSFSFSKNNGHIYLESQQKCAILRLRASRAKPEGDVKFLVTELLDYLPRLWIDLRAIHWNHSYFTLTRFISS